MARKPKEILWALLDSVEESKRPELDYSGEEQYAYLGSILYHSAEEIREALEDEDG